MRLELGNFHVKDIAFGDTLSFKDGVLTINKQEALDFIMEDDRITEADLYIAKPGDHIRMCPVKEAIEPRVRPDGRGLFPGYTSELKKCGEGTIHALKECSVLVVGKHWGGFQDGVIDMCGEGQKLTYFGQLNNIVLVADTNEEFERYEQQKKNDALRRAGHKLAEYIGSAVKDTNGSYRLLTGNETGMLLLDFICSRRIANGTMPAQPVAVKTIVTTDMAEQIADHYGVRTINVLTGFKFIGEQIGLLEKEGKEKNYIFGMEESYGYLTGTYVRDKDAVDASFMIAEMFAYYKSQGIGLLQKLDELYKTYGCRLNTLHSYAFEGESGFEKMKKIMKAFRGEMH